MQYFLENSKEIIGIISVLITFIGYYIYIKDIFYWQNKPHFFSWLVWGVITMIIYFIQVQDNSGAGSWVALFSGLISLLIAWISIFKWTKDITFSDKVSLFLAFIAIWLYVFNENPFWALILAVSIDIFGYYPTFRKSFKSPFEENYTMYALSILKFGLAIFALNIITFENSLYLTSNFIILFFLVAVIVLRRKNYIKV